MKLLVASICAGILLVGCSVAKQHSGSGSSTPEIYTISGAITYRERMPLPPESKAHITLSDISRADAAAIVLTEQHIQLDGLSVPIPFEFDVDSRQLTSVGRYAVHAVIRGSGGELLWTTDTVNLINPALKNQTLPELILVRVRRTSSASGVGVSPKGGLSGGAFLDAAR